MRSILPTIQIFAAVLMSLGSALAFAQTSVGQVVAIKGEVIAQASQGDPRTLMKSDQVFEGDSISTGDGAYALIQFIDGAKATMRPNTNLVVDTYSFGAGSDEGVLRLVKGGLRALTGEIAGQNPDSYVVQTQVATLGVRGTEFSIRVCEEDCALEEAAQATNR